MQFRYMNERVVAYKNTKFWKDGSGLLYWKFSNKNLEFNLEIKNKFYGSI